MVLIGTVLIMLTTALIGAALVGFFSSVMTLSELEMDRTQALYLAESGVARMVYEFRKANAFGGDTTRDIFPTSLAGGEYEVHHDVDTGIITSTGRFHRVERVVQVKYQPF